jgi:hypothetical protein
VWRRLLNTRKITSHRTHGDEFAFGVNAATKRPVENNKRGTSEKQRSAELMHSKEIHGKKNQSPGAVIRPGATLKFQFPEYSDSRTNVKSFMLYA